MGANPQTIQLDDSYSELGATAVDDVDGDLTSEIAIDASGVDTSTVGVYPVTYDVVDAAGNQATQVVRTVLSPRRSRPSRPSGTTGRIRPMSSR